MKDTELRADMMAVRRWFYLVVLLSVNQRSSRGTESGVPELSEHSYQRLGDLNLGILLGIHGYSEDSFCDMDTLRPSEVELLETLVYAIGKVNERSDLLPNVTLGFVAADDCRKELTALARAVAMVNRSSPIRPGSLNDAVPMGGNAAADGRNGDIVGTIGPMFSGQSIMVSSFMGLFHVPVLSPTATNDELEDSTRFGYFLRTLLPDAYQSTALVELLTHFRWTYVSLVYSEGGYSEGNAKHVEKQVKQRGICIAYSHRIASDAGRVEYDDVARELSRNAKARVVVTFLFDRQALALYEALDRGDASAQFIWLSGDIMMGAWPLSREANWGIFTGYHGGHLPGFDEYFNSLHCDDNPNPWIGSYCQALSGCGSAMENDTRDVNDCTRNKTIGQIDEIVPSSNHARWADAVLIYAHALHSLISGHCPEVLDGDKTGLKSCVSGSRLLQYMKNVSFQGFAGHMQFDEEGHIRSGYTLDQVQQRGKRRKPVTCGEWGRQIDGELAINISCLMWPESWLIEEVTGDTLSYPESVCSKPCSRREYTHQLELSCCWDCRRCRSNEYITANNSGCGTCPVFTWPDDVTGRECLALTPTYLRHSDVAGAILLGLALLGAVAALVVIGIIVRNFHRKLIKASSRELSMIILAGVLLACLDTCAFIMPPSLITCILRQAGFHFAVTVINAPLLIKTSRIYRIFAAGLKGNTKPRFTSSKTQVTFAVYVIILQVIFLLVVQLKSPSVTERRKPIPTVPEVEMACARPLWGFLLPLCYNMAIIMACALLGFLTRKLPENFNESWFIFISVATTLFMWAVFIPAYFTAFYASHQTALLSTCLLLNAFITLGCQFGPKLYALYYVKEENIKFATLTTVTTVHVHPIG